MKPRTYILLAVATVGCLTGSIQLKQFVGELKSSDRWLLAEKDEQVVLVAPTADANPKNKGVEFIWRISAPHLQASAGRYLAIDETDAGIRLSLSVKKSDSTRWTIDVVSSTAPKPSTASGRGLLTGTASKSFRLRLFDGPHEGWYLAAEPIEVEADTKSNPTPPHRNWRITQDPKQAAQFDYIETRYSVGGK